MKSATLFNWRFDGGVHLDVFNTGNKVQRAVFQHISLPPSFDFSVTLHFCLQDLSMIIIPLYMFCLK